MDVLLKSALFVLLVYVFSGVVIAQEDTTCSAIVQQALAVTAEACTAAGRNQACYGNLDLVAEPQAGVTDLNFDDTGDIEDVARISALRLSKFNEETGAWGVALMKLRANLPDTLPGQNVIVLLFGSVELMQDPNAEGLQPMQAFYFRAGVGDAPCAEAPDSGILIQTPQGAGLIDLRVNEVSIRLGSTAYLQAGESLTISVIEGAAQVTVGDTLQIVPAGGKVSVPLDENLAASGPPTDPEPYSMNEVRNVPAQALERPVEIAVPPAVGALRATIEAYRANLAAAQDFAGLWTATDLDGSFMTLQIDPLPQGGIYVRLYDEGASACERDLSVAAEVIGEGQINTAGALIVAAQWWCLRAEREARGSISLTYSTEGGAIRGDDGVGWERQSQPLPTADSSGDNVEGSEIQSTGNTDASTDSSPGGITQLEISDCQNWRAAITAGQMVAFQIGVGRWETVAETRAALAGHSATITLDGAPLNVYYEGYTYHGPGGYGDRARANWLATPGTHTVAGEWSIHGGMQTCTFTVVP